MREILFRAKRVDNREWVGGYFIKDDITGQTFIHAQGNSVNESQKIGEEGCLCFVAFEVDPETLCQYTGLTDKNGQRIWENDILHRAYHSEDDCIVVWHDGRFNFQTIHGQYNQDHMTLLSLCFNQGSVERLTVIGNIFDNPKLLKED